MKEDACYQYRSFLHILGDGFRDSHAELVVFRKIEVGPLKLENPFHLALVIIVEKLPDAVCSVRLHSFA